MFYSNLKWLNHILFACLDDIWILQGNPVLYDDARSQNLCDVILALQIFMAKKVFLAFQSGLYGPYGPRKQNIVLKFS